MPYSVIKALIKRAGVISKDGFLTLSPSGVEAFPSNE